MQKGVEIRQTVEECVEEKPCLAGVLGTCTTSRKRGKQRENFESQNSRVTYKAASCVVSECVCVYDTVRNTKEKKKRENRKKERMSVSFAFTDRPNILL